MLELFILIIGSYIAFDYVNKTPFYKAYTNDSTPYNINIDYYKPKLNNKIGTYLRDVNELMNYTKLTLPGDIYDYNSIDDKYYLNQMTPFNKDKTILNC